MNVAFGKVKFLIAIRRDGALPDTILALSAAVLGQESTQPSSRPVPQTPPPFAADAAATPG